MEHVGPRSCINIEPQNFVWASSFPKLHQLLVHSAFSSSCFSYSLLSLCPFTLCFHSVLSLCAFTLCFHFAFHSVLSLSTFTLCFTLCTHIVLHSPLSLCAFTLCIHSAFVRLNGRLLLLNDDKI